MTGAFKNMNKDNVLIYFLYIHLIFYKKYMIESLESRLVFKDLKQTLKLKTLRFDVKK